MSVLIVSFAAISITPYKATPFSFVSAVMNILFNYGCKQDWLRPDSQTIDIVLFPDLTIARSNSCRVLNMSYHSYCMHNLSPKMLVIGVLLGIDVILVIVLDIVLYLPLF